MYSDWTFYKENNAQKNSTMKITFFFRPPMKGVYSIETVFQQLMESLPKKIKRNEYYCTNQWKRYRSYWKARKNQGDVNHITGDIHTLALFLNGKKTILTVHDIGRFERNLSGLHKIIIKYIWLKWPLKRVAYVTAISNFTKQKLIDICNIPRDKIIVIPNPARLDFQPCHKDKINKNPIILQIGGSPVKNLSRLIKAVSNTSFRLLLLREPSKELERELNKNNIKYEFRYNLSREEVYKCYCECDILFFASEHEGFGVPILEAQRVGRAVITSDFPPMNNVAGEGALLVDPYSVSSIKLALDNLVTDSFLYKDLIKKGETNLQRFDTQNISNQYQELYSKILNSK